MAQQKSVEECKKWIEEQQKQHERAKFGYSRPEVEVAANEQRQRSKEVSSYASSVDRVKGGLKEPALKDGLDRSYISLKETSQTRLECLENNSKIVGLDYLFSPLSNTIHALAAGLTRMPSNGAQPETDNTGYNAQRCTLATRSAWEYISKQLKCSEIQLRHASEYQLFFYDISQYYQWMAADLRTVKGIVLLVNNKKDGQVEDPAKLLPEMKAALATYQNWRGRIDATYERSTKLIPIQLRLQRLAHERPITALCDYRTNDLDIIEGEELVILDNSKPDMWKVRNLRSDVGHVPSVQLVINGPDLAAIDEAMKLRFNFFDNWVESVRRLGKALIHYLLGSLKDWTPEEELKLKALSHADKQMMKAMLKSITDVLSPYWDIYAPYKGLRTKIERLLNILDASPSRDYRDDGRPGPILVGRSGTIEEMMMIYKLFWDNWEQFRCLSDAKHAPENILGQKDWDKYKLLDSIECLRKWQADLNTTDQDLMDGMVIEDEIYTIETNKETSETSHISTSEQEEKQTFVITAVEDPTTGLEISLQKAVALGIIDQAEGKYVNPRTRERIPIPAAMNLGKIQVEFTTTKKSAEKRSDLGLITIKTQIEARPFTVKGVVDAKTEKHLTVEEAIRAGIMDQKRGIYRNMVTRQELSMADALESGLLIVEFENEEPTQNGNGDAHNVMTKTYAIHGVIDMRSSRRLTFTEAVDAGIMDGETGAYTNSRTGETFYVGDAIKQGFIKASVVNDPKTLDIAPGNMINLVSPVQEKLQRSVVAPIKVVSAFASSATKVTSSVHAIGSNSPSAAAAAKMAAPVSVSGSVSPAAKMTSLVSVTLSPVVPKMANGHANGTNGNGYGSHGSTEMNGNGVNGAKEGSVGSDESGVEINGVDHLDALSGHTEEVDEVY